MYWQGLYGFQTPRAAHRARGLCSPLRSCSVPRFRCRQGTPRDGSLTLSDIREPTLAIVCERCGRHGRYNVARLIAAHGADAKLTALLVTLANCEKARSFSVYDRCKARFEGFSFRA
jgi:hypothetical protein